MNILNPVVGLYIMVTRKDPAGKVHGADQALTREEALRLYTNAGPYYTFEERNKGSIEVGKLADMVVLSADYMTSRTSGPCRPSSTARSYTQRQNSPPGNKEAPPGDPGGANREEKLRVQCVPGP